PVGSATDASSPDGSSVMTDATTASDAPALADSGVEGGSDADAGPLPSAGCGRPWTGLTGQWVSQPTGCAEGANNQGTAGCQTIPPGTTVPAMASSGTAERRGWWVLVPSNYDPSKPYTVIYEAASEGDAN